MSKREFGISVAHPRRVYVAARSELRDRAIACAKLLRNNGILVTSSWHDDPRFVPNLATSVDDNIADRECDRDDEEIRASTHIVRISDGKAGSGANLVEWGMARAYGVVRILVGKKTCLFDRDRGVTYAQEGEDLLAKIRA